MDFSGCGAAFAVGGKGSIAAYFNVLQAKAAHSIKFSPFSSLSATQTCSLSLNFLAKYLRYFSASAASVKIGKVLVPWSSSTENIVFGP